ncbi:DUF4476 domain-containing protein [Adhaeribacter aerolatus]|nr:DUF4476 domain-containing protein [Adhaeribacter aerolatus]
MKPLVVLFFGMLLWTQQAFASRASVSFASKHGEPFLVAIDGRLINHRPTNRFRLNDIPAGYHDAEIRFPDRYGALVHRARLFLEPGYETEYVVQVVGRRPRVVLNQVRRYPINGGIVPPPYPVPEPPRPRPDYPDRDNDRDRDNACPDLLAGAEFERFFNTLASRPFDDDKLSLAKQVIGQSTIYAEDLKRVMKQFSFDNRKSDLAKFAYNNVCDRRNFYVVYDAFTFESSARELERYMNELAR